jgi:hypothetical protein
MHAATDESESELEERRRPTILGEDAMGEQSTVDRNQLRSDWIKA